MENHDNSSDAENNCYLPYDMAHIHKSMSRPYFSVHPDRPNWTVITLVRKLILGMAMKRAWLLVNDELFENLFLAKIIWL